MEQNRIILSIFADEFDVLTFYREVGIETAKYWNKGDMGQYNTCKKETAWHLEICNLDNFDFEDSFIELQKVLEEKSELIHQYAKEFNLCIKVFVIACKFKGTMPSIVIENRLLKLLASLDVVIDIDLY